MATITKKDLTDELAEFDITVDDEAVLEKLKMICYKYKLSAEVVVNEWVAFSANSIELSLKSLDDFDSKLACDRKNKPEKFEDKSVKTYNKDNIDTLMPEDLSILQMYQTPEHMISNKRFRTTPESKNKMIHTKFGQRTPAISPASLPTPISSTPAKRYESRENAGEVVTTFNPTCVLDENISWSRQQDVKIKNVVDEPLTKKYKYMFQKIIDKTQALNDRIDKIASFLKKSLGIDEFQSPGIIHQNEVSVAGRVCCDTNGRLNASSLILRESGTNGFGYGTSVSLSINDVNKYSLFPGKVIAAKGKNPTGKQFIASSFYEEISPSPAEPARIPSDSLSIYTAVGPFTTTESDSYEPLRDFLNEVTSVEPDVVIMMGPFVDVKMSSLNISTKFIIVPSHRDVHHDCVYPQPLLCERYYKHFCSTLRTKPKSKETESQEIEKIISALHFFSDPCTIEINGFTIGMTSTDVMLHMGGEEIVSPPGSTDKMGRLIHNILTQQCYYPLFPPSEDVCIDYETFAEHAHLPCRPDAFIVPSDLRYFVKDILGTLCINPGRLTKGLVGGTFARFLLRKDQGEQSVVSKSYVQIVKI
ncbi:LOW QUALITY PROTEIN: DNA polymerase alpha subunit B-like [Xenia sp. Carnegie-2017]|uniref:LOW QUALITY PROTEIN: DNA polymerase alpha subunit B-like n=1 Tax=Xenia sp. Carnegie-2017 TaxID=2897299 RepID=UPI001F033354|nr:LOW QUALITY PROTEIN: DNA polymerase alpha subunit B-like [Xenia sp. Carnegie-2017]